MSHYNRANKQENREKILNQDKESIFPILKGLAWPVNVSFQPPEETEASKE